MILDEKQKIFTYFLVCKELSNGDVGGGKGSPYFRR